jgi:phosphoribosylformylglycinamidine synthase
MQIKPTVFMPVFPGTNCEVESENEFIKAGARVNKVLFLNQNSADIKNSIKAYSKAIKNSQIIFIPGGFSAGDEPNGSAKFIVAVFYNLQDEIHEFLEKGHLILGICNGFQALIKLGLLPFGKITAPNENSPTLTFNDIGVHQSRLVRTKIISNKSPWLKKTNVGEIYTIPVSHGEGKFVYKSKDIFKCMQKNNQIASTYVDFLGSESMSTEFNPNGSYNSVEGITSKDGRIFGKMAHSERVLSFNYKNTGADVLHNQKLFLSGVEYIKNIF